MIEQLVTCDFCKKASVKEDHYDIYLVRRDKSYMAQVGQMLEKPKNCCLECIKKLGNHYEVPKIGD